jgi:1,2-diacylglycerol 3-alpha-glucosyltransferase
MSSRNIRTGIFNDSFYPITDGVAMVTKNYAFWLNRLMGPSCVITPDMPDQFDSEEFPVYRYTSFPIPLRPPYRFGINLVGEVVQKRQKEDGLRERLTNNVFRIPFDIVHAHCPFSSGQLAQRVARNQRIPLVATFHTKYRLDFETSLKNKFLVEMAMNRLVSFYERADHVWVPSADTIETMREYGYKGEIEVMPNGTDLIVNDAELSKLSQEGEEEFAVPAGVPMLMYLGQHIREKNLDVLVEALDLVVRSKLDFRMIFIGDGYHRAALVARVNELGLSDKVFFKGVIRDREMIKRAYARADILFFPSLYDTSSLIVKEAAGMRLPALLVKGATTAEGIIDGVNGFLAPNTPEDLANRLVSALQNPDSIIKAGLGAYSSLYRSWEQVIGMVSERYEHIIRSKASQI